MTGGTLMDPRVAPLAEIFDLNRRLFHNCLEVTFRSRVEKGPSAPTTR